MRTLIFDFDGVFTDSFSVSLEVFQTLHKKYRIADITKEDLCELFCGNLWEEHKRYGLSEEDEGNFKKELLTLVGERQGEISFFSDIKNTIEKLAEKEYALIIISSNKSSVIKEKLATIQLENAFTEILGADKPGNKQEKMKEILRRVGENENSFFVTDTLGDIKEVKKFPLTIVAVSWGFHSKELLEKGAPDFIAETPAKLYEILTQ